MTDIMVVVEFKNDNPHDDRMHCIIEALAKPKARISKTLGSCARGIKRWTTPSRRFVPSVKPYSRRLDAECAEQRGDLEGGNLVYKNLAEAMMYEDHGDSVIGNDLCPAGILSERI
jgi:hypothetical protein